MLGCAPARCHHQHRGSPSLHKETAAAPLVAAVPLAAVAPLAAAVVQATVAAVALATAAAVAAAAALDPVPAVAVTTYQGGMAYVPVPHSSGCQGGACS